MAGWLLALVIAAAGCSVLVNVDKVQCSIADDCVRLGLPGSCIQGACSGTSAAPSACDDDCPNEVEPGSCKTDSECSASGSVCFKTGCANADTVAAFRCKPAMPGAAPPEQLTYGLRVREFVTQQAPKRMTILACRPNDVSCENPVARYVDDAGSGDVSLQLPYGFQGFLDLRSDDIVTELFYFTKPYTEPKSRLLLVATPQTVEILVGAAGYVSDPSRGLVIVEGYDCAGQAASGISFGDSDRGGARFYLINSAPNFESAVTARDEVSDLALGGFFNAVVGFTRISARIGEDGPLLGEFNVNVRPNTITYLEIHP
jgi:hypothetical protein